MGGAERIRKQRNGSRGGRHHAQPELSDEAGLQRRDLLFESIAVGQHASRPVHEPLAFGSETFKLLVTPDQGHLQFLFELADGFRQCRLGHVTGARGPREVPLLSERYEVLKLT